MTQPCPYLRRADAREHPTRASPLSSRAFGFPSATQEPSKGGNGQRPPPRATSLEEFQLPPFCSESPRRFGSARSPLSNFQTRSVSRLSLMEANAQPSSVAEREPPTRQGTPSAPARRCHLH